MKAIAVFFLLAVFAAGFYLMGYFVAVHSQENLPVVGKILPAKEPALADEAITKIRNNFVDKVPGKKLDDAAIEGAVDVLSDPYSQYFPPTEHKAFQEMINGSFFGIGIIIGERKGSIVVVSPIPGTPAAKAGLLADDVITKIDGKTTKGMKLNKAVTLIKGPKGTKVMLTIERKNAKKPIVARITRDEIKIPNVSEKKIGKVGYIVLATFDGTADRRLRQAVDSLTKKGCKAFVLDLRNNGGGLLSEAVGVSSVFIKDGRIVSLVERGGKVTILPAMGQAATDRPIAVLINKGSASASEIVAGAIKDRKRGFLIGEQSFGKGSVQTDFQLSNGGGLKITTAKYLTPSGRSIDKVGVTPDYKVKSGKATGHGFGGNFVRYQDDPQLKKAIELLNAKLR